MLAPWACLFVALLSIVAVHSHRSYRSHSGHNSHESHEHDYHGHGKFLSRHGSYHERHGYGSPHAADSHEHGSKTDKKASVSHNHYYYAHAHNQYSGSDASHAKAATSHDEKSYTFQVGDDFGPFEYIGTDGKVHGWNIDVFFAVCKQAKKRCYYILDQYDRCWTTKGVVESPGIGLLARWYIGCIGLFPTQRRQNSFNFTTPYTRNVKAAIHQRAGETIENPTNLKGKKIGFVTGWAPNKDCLSRQSAFTHNHAGEYTPITFGDHIQLVAALKSKQVDLILTMKEAVKADKEIAAITPDFHCTKGGLSVMTHYGSELLDWWNPAFQQLQQNGQYTKLCEEGKKKHGSRGDIPCL